MADGAKANPADLTATEARAAIGRGELTATALVEACLARITASDSEIRAWSHVDREGALAAARARDEHRRRGRPLGALHGLPIGVKDIIAVAGQPLENGAPLDAGRVAKSDATCIRRLKAEGAIILGKTVTTEMAGPPPSMTRNPHDLTRSPGGSSAGSAAAVAAGYVPLALGTQTNGSVIRPASFCGVVGFKASFGAVPRTGVLPVSSALDHVGVFARSVADVALLEHMTGGDGEDTDALPHRLKLSATAAEAPPVTPVIGFFEGPTWSEAAPGTPEAFDELVDAIPGCQHIATPMALTRIKELIACIMQVEAAHLLGHYVDRDATQVHPLYRNAIEEGRRVPATAYLEARTLQPRLRAAFDEVFEEVDALVTPAAPGEAPGPETTGNPAFCSLWSFTGLPAVTLPLMTGPAGLPLGVQLIGPAGDDARLLRTAAWLVSTLAKAPAHHPGVPA
ncbi:MAG: amidase [Pseudomonadota bacterium]